MFNTQGYFPTNSFIGCMILIPWSVQVGQLDACAECGEALVQLLTKVEQTFSVAFAILHLQLIKTFHLVHCNLPNLKSRRWRYIHIKHDV